MHSCSPSRAMNNMNLTLAHVSSLSSHTRRYVHTKSQGGPTQGVAQLWERERTSERSSPPVTELRRPFSFRREPMEEMERARRWPPFFPSFPSFSAVPATAAGAAGAGKCCCCCWCCSCCCCCCIETSSCAETRCDAAKGEADAIEDGWLESAAIKCQRCHTSEQ